MATHAPEPFTLSGTLAVTWDGTACRIEGPPPPADLTRIQLTNSSTTPVALVVAGVATPKRWADAIALLAALDLGDPNLQIPDWVIQVPASLSAQAGQQASAIVTLPAAEVGAVCGTGQLPGLEFFDAGSFIVGG